MNRRQMLSGGAVALTSRKLSLIHALMPQSLSVSSAQQEAPKKYLGPILTQALLQQHLAAPGTWTPSPKLTERERWQTIPADVRRKLVERSEAFLREGWQSLPSSLFLGFKQNGNRTEYERVYFARRQKLTNLVLAECIEARGRFLPTIVDGAWLICEESFWGLPAHLGAQKAGTGLPDVGEPIVDLFAAETAATLSFVDYLLDTSLDAVSPLIRKRIALEAKRRILDPCLTRSDFSWMGLAEDEHRLNNWTPWICSNWIATNLLLETDRERQIAATIKACKCLDRYLEDYSADGGCEEGPSYWAVAAASYIECVAALESSTGLKNITTNNQFLKQMVHFIIDAHIAGDYYVNYGDAHPKVEHSSYLLHRCGRIAGDSALEAYAGFLGPQHGFSSNNGGQGKLMREVADTFEAALLQEAPKVDALERTSWYPALGLMTARQISGSSKGLYLAVQAAQNSRSHGHNDSGSFILFHDGDPVFIDVGVEAYTAKTFSPDRYSIWTMQSAYHNLPTVNDVMQSAASERFRATDLCFADAGDDTSLRMNLASAYPAEAGIKTWQRTLTMLRSKQRVRLEESFEGSHPSKIAFSLMTPRTPSFAAQGNLALRNADGKEVHLVFDNTLLEAKWEQIALKDPGLQQSWGTALYRVLLMPKQPVPSGKWTLEILSA